MKTGKRRWGKSYSVLRRERKDRHSKRKRLMWAKAYR